MRQYDILQKFIFESADIRGEFVHLHHCIKALVERHPYPQPVLNLLSQALSAVALLSGTIKFEGALILQTETNGAINVLVAQSNEKQHIRGLAKWDEARLEEGCLLGEGRLAITIIPDNAKDKRYQGIVEISDDNFTLAFETYFMQSEQLATKLWLASDGHRAAGLLLQKMPSDNSDWAYWEHVSTLAATISDQELLNLDNTEILHRLFHEEDIRLFDESPAVFKCRCTKEKMEKAILTCGEAEIETLLIINPVIDVTCEFCNQQYSFDKVDVARIFATS